MIGLLGWQGNHNYVSDIVSFTFETIITMQTFTRWGASWRLSWYLGSWSLWIIHRWRRTWAAVNLLWGSTWSIFDTRSCQQRSLKIIDQTDRTLAKKCVKQKESLQPLPQLIQNSSIHQSGKISHCQSEPEFLPVYLPAH